MPRIAVAALVWMTLSGVALPPAGAAPAEGKYAGMVLIPAGPFQMGRDNGPDDEKPAHQVYLSAFYIDRNLVRVSEYAEFIRAKSHLGPLGEMYLDAPDPDARIHRRGGVWTADKGFENYPAAELSWHGAVAYCRWRGKRLPSEAEWEKAARGTDGRLYPWGNQPPTQELAFFGGFHGETVPVGRYPKGASPYGVLDMAGQVWEWTRSLYRKYPYQSRDGRENLKTEDTRVARGGTSSSDAEGLTATSRTPVDPGRLDTGHAYFGFRCAANLEMVQRSFRKMARRGRPFSPPAPPSPLPR
ncbi:MAG: SUMF1/EgtB/PvdO family nonheme iron enzyme [bacterium]|nr:SUMF1/EgtB/PvdO family nonheme iron enzyme [bacterium]